MSSSSDCAVLSWSLPSLRCLSVLSLRWMLLRWEGRGLQEVQQLERQLLSILVLLLPHPYPGRHQLQSKSKGAFVSHPDTTGDGMVLEQPLHASCIRCLDMIHCDILDMQHYHSAMKTMGWLVCVLPPPDASVVEFLKGMWLPKSIPEVQPFL